MKNVFKSTPFMAIFTCLLWGSSFVPTKTGLQYMDAPLQFAGYTFVLAGIFMMPWAKIGKHYIRQVVDYFDIILKVAIFSITILYGTYYSGMRLTDGSIASLIVGCQPFFVALLAHVILKNEKFNMRKKIGMVLGIVGIIVVSWPNFNNIQMTGFSSALGIILIITDCLSAAYGNIIVSQIDFSKVDIKVLNSAASLLGGIVLLIFAYPVEGVMSLPHEPDFYISLGVMVLITVITTIIWMRLLSRKDVKVASLNMWKFILPLIGSLESWIFLKGDDPDMYSIAGLIIITASLLIFFVQRQD